MNMTTKFNPGWNTCRLCHNWDCDEHTGPMMKYSVRSYAHARCGCVRFGREWLDKQPRWVIEQFPAFLARDLMIEDYIRARLAEREEVA